MLAMPPGDREVLTVEFTIRFLETRKDRSAAFRLQSRRNVPHHHGCSASAMIWISAPLVAFMLAQGQSPDTDVAALTRLEAEWNDAHVQGDAVSLGRIFADDLVVAVPGMRLMNKADSLGMFTAGRMKFERYESSETQSRIYGDTAIVTGRIRRTRTTAGKTVDDDWRFTKVYLRRTGGWQVVTFHASNVSP